MQRTRRKIGKEIFTPGSRQPTQEDHLADIAAAIDASNDRIASAKADIEVLVAWRFHETGWSNSNGLFRFLARS